MEGTFRVDLGSGFGFRARGFGASGLGRRADGLGFGAIRAVQAC